VRAQELTSRRNRDRSSRHECGGGHCQELRPVANDTAYASDQVDLERLLDVSLAFGSRRVTEDANRGRSNVTVRRPPSTRRMAICDASPLPNGCAARPSPDRTHGIIDAVDPTQHRNDVQRVALSAVASRSSLGTSTRVAPRLMLVGFRPFLLGCACGGRNPSSLCSPGGAEWTLQGFRAARRRGSRKRGKPLASCQPARDTFVGDRLIGAFDVQPKPPSTR
jgi:hypothetical protein